MVSLAMVSISLSLALSLPRARSLWPSILCCHSSGQSCPDQSGVIPRQSFGRVGEWDLASFHSFLSDNNNPQEWATDYYWPITDMIPKPKVKAIAHDRDGLSHAWCHPTCFTITQFKSHDVRVRIYYPNEGIELLVCQDKCSPDILAINDFGDQETELLRCKAYINLNFPLKLLGDRSNVQLNLRQSVPWPRQTNVVSRDSAAS